MTVCLSFNAKSPTYWLAPVLCVVAFFTVASAEDLPRLVLNDGKIVSARFLSFSEEQISYTDDESNLVQSVPIKSVVRWGNLANPITVDQLLLTDGSILIGRITRVTRDAFVVETDLWGELTIPRSSMLGAIWRLPTDPIEQWKLRDKITSGGESDGLILKNGDVLEGKLLSGSSQIFKLLTATGPVEVKTRAIAAWQRKTRRSKAIPKGVVCGLSDGTQLFATKLRVDDRIHANLGCGFVVGSLLGIRPADERLVSYLRPTQSDVVYLSDLEPIGYKHIPFLKMDWPWQADRNALRGPLSSAGGMYYSKGLGMHSTARLAFQLENQFEEFQAEVCLDDSAGQNGSVVFRLFTFGEQQKWEETYKSPVVRGGELPRAVRVPLNGATRLALVVDFADRGDVLDRANWLGARVVGN